MSAAVFTLLFSFGVETLQYFTVVDKLGLEKSRIARTVIGTSFEWIDLLAYLGGIIIVLLAERLRSKKLNQ